MRKNIQTTEAIFPMPVLMIATYNEDGSVDVMNAAWGTMLDRNQVILNLTETHKTVKNMKTRKAFTVSIADVDHVKEADYFGVVSGNNTPDKFEKSGLTYTHSEHVDAPIINEFPICMECEFIEYQDDEYGCGVIGKVVNVTADEHVITDEKVDIEKVPGQFLEPLAKALHTTPAYLMGWDDDPVDYDDGEIVSSIPLNYLELGDGDVKKAYQIQQAVDKDVLQNNASYIPSERVVSIRFLGSVAAGYNQIANDEHEFLNVPEDWLGRRRPDDFFALRVKGDSMYPKYCNGDEILCLHNESPAESGQVYVVLYGDEEATLKKIECSPNEDYIDLVPINPMFPPKRIEGADIDQFRILGRVVRLIRTEDIDNEEGV